MNKRNYIIDNATIPGFVSVTESLIVPGNEFPSFKCPWNEEDRRVRYPDYANTDFNKLHVMKVVDVEGHDSLKAIVCDECDTLLMLLRNPELPQTEREAVAVSRGADSSEVGDMERMDWSEFGEDKHVFGKINDFLNPSFPPGFIADYQDKEEKEVKYDGMWGGMVSSTTS